MHLTGNITSKVLIIAHGVFVKQKIFLSIIAIFLFGFSVKNSSADFSSWTEKLSGLKPEMSRLDAEKIIEKAREVKSSYSTTSMDSSRFVIYELDKEFLLVARYQPGAPRPLIKEPDDTLSHGTAASGKDGKLIDFMITSKANIK